MRLCSTFCSMDARAPGQPTAACLRRFFLRRAEPDDNESYWEIDYGTGSEAENFVGRQ